MFYDHVYTKHIRDLRILDVQSQILPYTGFLDVDEVTNPPFVWSSIYTCLPRVFSGMWGLVTWWLCLKIRGSVMMLIFTLIWCRFRASSIWWLATWCMPVSTYEMLMYSMGFLSPMIVDNRIVKYCTLIRVAAISWALAIHLRWTPLPAFSMVAWQALGCVCRAARYHRMLKSSCGGVWMVLCRVKQHWLLRELVCPLTVWCG